MVFKKEDYFCLNLCLNICPFKVREWLGLLQEAFLMFVSCCLVNQSRKTIPSESRLSNGILRWQQEVCKSRCQIREGSADSVPTIKLEWIDLPVTAVPSIIWSLYLSVSHLSSSVLFNVVNFPIVFQKHQQPSDPERAWQSNSEI